MHQTSRLLRWFRLEHQQLIAAVLLAAAIEAVLPAFTISNSMFNPASLFSPKFAMAQDSAPGNSPDNPSVEDATMSQSPVQIDPLNSPYPVPWGWVQAVLSESQELQEPAVRYYRSPSLISPDGEYAAYSRVQMQVQPNFVQSRVSSVLFLENLQTGNLQTITASSPFADNLFSANPVADRGGTIAILMPVAWSVDSDRILAREFESLFGTDLASDYAVIWDQTRNQAYTVAPTQVRYSNAVLLGWSQSNPDQVLFRAGNLGDEEWPLWAVASDGYTIAATDDEPLVYGQVVSNVWTGPQAHYARQ